MRRVARKEVTLTLGDVLEASNDLIDRVTAVINERLRREYTPVSSIVLALTSIVKACVALNLGHLTDTDRKFITGVVKSTAAEIEALLSATRQGE